MKAKNGGGSGYKPEAAPRREDGIKGPSGMDGK